jgi:hypothetical protein
MFSIISSWFFPYYETVAGIGIEASLAVGSETDNPYFHTGTVAKPDGWFPQRLPLGFLTDYSLSNGLSSGGYHHTDSVVIPRMALKQKKEITRKPGLTSRLKTHNLFHLRSQNHI